jgi:hypothetical protein
VTRYITDINTATPDGQTDLIADGDSEFRTLKADLKNSFPKIAGEVSASSVDLNKLYGFVGNVVTDAGDTFTGTVGILGTLTIHGELSLSGGSVHNGTARFNADVTVSGTLVSTTFLRGQEAGFGGTVSFSAAARGPTPSDGQHYANKAYVDAAIVAGADPTTVDVREFKNARLKLFYYGQM